MTRSPTTGAGGDSREAPPEEVRRRRRDIVASNDEAIVDAVVGELAEGGWGRLTVAAVARRCNLTHRAVQPRHGTKGEMAAAAWERRCAPALLDSLDGILAAATEPAARLTGSHASTSVKDLLDAWTPVIADGVLARATSEVLVVRQFDPYLAESVDRTLGAWLRTHCLPPPGGTVDVALSRRAYLVADALGLLLTTRLPSAADADLRPHAEDLHHALGVEIALTELPADRAEHMDRLAFTETPGATTGNAVHDAILDATLALVGSVGYDASTTTRIARMAKVNESVIFAHYRTKLELFMDATLRQWQAGLTYNDAFASRIATEHGVGIAEATLFREAQRPGREAVRAISLEQLRLGWHQAPLAQLFDSNLQQYVAATRQQSPAVPEQVARARTLGEFAVSQGVVLLAQVLPGSWTVPLDAMCVAMSRVTRA